jgi:hypothetical protein
MNQEKFANDFEAVGEEEMIRQLNERLAEVNPRLEKIYAEEADLEKDLQEKRESVGNPLIGAGEISLPLGVLSFVAGGNPLPTMGVIAAIGAGIFTVRAYLLKRTEKQHDAICEELLNDIENIEQLTESLKKLNMKKLEGEGATWQSVVDADGSLSRGLVLTTEQQQNIPDTFKSTQPV